MRSLAVIVVVALIFGFLARIGMEILNRKMGLDAPVAEESEEHPENLDNYTLPEIPDYQTVEMTESGTAVWNPDWKSTPCSLYVSGQDTALLDSLPLAPEPANRPTELQLLMELWGSRSGYSQTEIEHVWAFSRGDTCFIDLPRAPDWTAVQRTIEARFISYTVMFPFVSGDAVNGYDEGIPLRGIPSIR